VWWYVDALSDDGRSGLTLIAFIGSVFSPYYYRARARGPSDPRAHCALNVALYGPGRKRWTMTERGRAALARSATHLALGPSALAWDGGALTVHIDEITVPLPSRVRGVVRLHPQGLGARSFSLDAGGHHRWRPIAPRARVEVVLERPRLRWQGTGYLDSNAGDRPLERDFSGWHWSRAPLRQGTVLLYEVTARAGGTAALALRASTAGELEPLHPPPPAALPPTAWWRVARATRAEATPRLVRTLEDTPFYARSLLETTLLGERATAVHETLSLDRFRTAWVRALLPFRMPRARR